MASVCDPAEAHAQGMGRRRNHTAKAGGAKRSSTTIAKAAFEAGVLHTLRLPKYELKNKHDAVVEDFHRRRLNLPVLAELEGWKPAEVPVFCLATASAR